MITVKQNGEVYEVSFPYDPFVVDIVKQIAGRRWVSQAKMWTIPRDKLGFLLAQFKGTQYEASVNVISEEQLYQNDTLDVTVKIPNIDISNVPYYVKEGATPYQHQLDFMKYAIYRELKGNMDGFLCCDDQGLGKALALDTKIYTPDGWKYMKDIQVGDRVFNEKGEPVEVLRTYDHDDLEMYRVTFSDGKSVTCCKDHLWYFQPQRGWVVWPLDKIIKGPNYGVKTPMRQRIKQYVLPKAAPVQFQHKDVPIDPWLLGFLLGDGSFEESGVSFTTSYENILEGVKTHLPDTCTISKQKSDTDGLGYLIVRSEKGRRSTPVRCIETGEIFNSVKDAEVKYQTDILYKLTSNPGPAYSYKVKLHFEFTEPYRRQYLNDLVVASKSLGLAGHTAAYKFIPDIYKYNDVETRWAVLQGLMDSDGYASPENYHDYSTISDRLASDVEEIAESLGGLVIKRHLVIKVNGEDYWYWSLTLRFDDPTNLYRYSDKKLRAKPRRFKPRRLFDNIEYVGRMPGKCITVSGDSHLYLCEHFIVTHNTMEAMNLAVFNQKQYRFQHCLVVCCINSSKYNWVKDIQEHTQGEHTPYILGSRLQKRSGRLQFLGGKEKLEDLQNLKMYGAKKGGKELPFFLILNVEAIRYKEGRKYPLADRLIELINQRYISMIVIDEVHKNLSPTSQQGKQLLRIKKTITETPLWLPLSGTPITKKPLDLFLPLRLINAHGYNSYYMWAKEYCLYGGFGGHEIIGYKNIPRLKAQLQANMIRRLKADVLDLPPKIRYTEYVDNTPYQERLYERTAAGLIRQQEEIVKNLNPLSRFLRLRQVNGNPELVEPNCDISDPRYIEKNAKLQRLMELLEEIHERGEKVVIFSNWVESLRTLYKFVSKKYKTCCFTGTMKEEERQKHKAVFINNPSYTVMMGTFGALGTTHTLTVARNEIMYDEPWNPSDKVQAEDRIYRIGTNSSVNIYTLITRDTVDDRVHDILYTKSGISEFIVDGKLDVVNNPKLFNLLLSDTIKTTNRGELEYEDYSE